MPLVVVEWVGMDDAQASIYAQVTADALGVILGSGNGQTWVRMRGLDAGCYAENGLPVASGQEPVFVTICRRALPEPAVLEMEAARIAQAIATIGGRSSERVHVIYDPPLAGRVAFGGRLVR